MQHQTINSTLSPLPPSFAGLIEKTNTRIVTLMGRTVGGHGARLDVGEIKETIAGLLSPGEVLRRDIGAAADDLVNPDAPGALVAGLHGPFFGAIEERIRRELSQLGVKRGAAPSNLTEIVAVLLIAALSERHPNCQLVRDWRRDLEDKHKTPFSYLTGEVADAIVGGVVPKQDGVGAKGKSWNEALAIELLETIVGVFGAEAVRGYADILVQRILAASQPDAVPGRYELPDGSVVVSVIGLSGVKLTPFSSLETLEAVFEHALEPDADLLDKLSERLEGSAYLWSGPIDSPERLPARRLAETVLQRYGWLRTWTPPVKDDRLAQTLAANRTAYPHGMAQRSFNAVENSIVDPTNGDAALDAGEIGAPSRDTGRETAGALQLLHSRDARYTFAPLAITLVGKQFTGKTTLLSGICHDILRGLLQPLPGHEVAFSDATQRFARRSGENWARGADSDRTLALLARYRFSFGPINVELTDIRGHELDHAEPATALKLEPTEGATPAARRAQDQARLVEHLRHANGIIVMAATPEFVAAARDGKDCLDQDAQFALDLQGTALANLMLKVGDIGGTRGADHRPVALVVNRADEIFAATDLDAVYRSAALLGDEDRGGFGTAGVGDHIKSYALRTAIGTVSIAAQSKVARIVDLLKPVLGFIARGTRRYEIFLTTGLPHELDGTRQLASGPGQILQWLLDQLLPSYVAQALEQIGADRKALTEFVALQAAATRYAQPLLSASRWSDFIEAIPGGRKLQRRYRVRLVGKLAAALKRVGIALESDPEPGEIQGALALFADRISFTRDAIEAARAELLEFRVALNAPRPQG